MKTAEWVQSLEYIKRFCVFEEQYKAGVPTLMFNIVKKVILGVLVIARV